MGARVVQITSKIQASNLQAKAQKWKIHELTYGKPLYQLVENATLLMSNDTDVRK